MKIVQNNIVCSISSEDYIEYSGKYYSVLPLTSSEDLEGGKGGNSNVFKLIDPDYEEDYSIIKFCKYHLDSEDEVEQTRISRFKNEIRALRKAKDKGSEGVIELQFHSMATIEGKDFLYYVMEKGQTDLLDYIQTQDITDQQKFVLCLEILNGIYELHNIGIYHRDIKPDNIFLIDNRPKIGDLGLSEHRDEDQSLDILREKIGPSGWLSPEAVNKMLCEDTKFEAVHCCTIKDYSDIFQLGKVIWYIFEGTAPVGQLHYEYFAQGNRTVFDLIISMLLYKKIDRPPMKNIIDTFNNQATAFLS
ncbi:protein kinase family protein [Pedobacter sp. UBA5917]|jgi:serine/threonine protein kinase|uniref:protein kinase family protein n=1 Tax=Pedobacter sp. UBA5917 TaxID=1947061 RepID=UPI0025E153AA|nr:protein kinase family protein [Pedobacter sp. UBA5917]